MMIALTWICAIAVVFQYTQIATTAGYICYGFFNVGTRREITDTAIAGGVAVACIVVRLLWAATGAGAGISLWFELAFTVIALGTGHYISTSLDRRLSFYHFCVQEDRRINDAANTDFC